MELDIVRLDHHGRGIAYADGKIVFIDNALPNEKVTVDVLRENSKYKEGKVTEYIEKSPNRINSKCPFYEECGGCQLRHMSYEDTIDFKKNKLEEIMHKYAGIDPKIEIIKSGNKDLYRNKIEVKIENGVLGFYKKRSHEIVEIDRCLNAEEAINSLLLNSSLLHIQNGTLTIKANYNGELILVINSEENPPIEIEKLREKHKLVGVILNDKLLFGSDHFIEIINDMFFKESYNSFFQVNRTINSELFKLIQENISSEDTVLDICSGVGTLSIVASMKAKKVYAIEIVENAVRDSLINSRMNKRENIEFMLGDAFSGIGKINDKIDTFIVDPPRSGLNKEALVSILDKTPSKIIYISCDPITLSRDLKVLLSKYEVDKYYLLDMFPYTYHVESAVLLKARV